MCAYLSSRLGKKLKIIENDTVSYLSNLRKNVFDLQGWKKEKNGVRNILSRKLKINHKHIINIILIFTIVKSVT